MADETHEKVIVDWDADDGDLDALGFDDLDDGDETYTSTLGLTVDWAGKDGHCILHASSRLAIGKAFARRSDAVATADRLDGLLPWSATVEELQQTPVAEVFHIADLVREGGGTFVTRLAEDGGAA